MNAIGPSRSEPPRQRHDDRAHRTATEVLLVGCAFREHFRLPPHVDCKADTQASHTHDVSSARAETPRSRRTCISNSRSDARDPPLFALCSLVLLKSCVKQPFAAIWGEC